MLLIAFGASTPFGRLGARLMEALIAASFERRLFMAINRLEELYAPLSGKSLQGISLFLTTPEHGLVTVTRRLNRKSVVFYEEPQSLFQDEMAKNGNNSLEAFRATSRHLACQTATLATGDAFVIRQNPWMTISQVTKAISLYFELHPDPKVLARELEALGGEAVPLSQILSSETSAPPDTEMRRDVTAGSLGLEALHEIVPSLTDLSRQRVSRELIWRTPHFFTQGAVNYAVSEASGSWEEMLGAARYLYFGPYFYLAPGRWSVRALFRVRDNISGNKVEFDVVQEGERLAYGRFDLPQHGVFEVDTSIFNLHPERSLEFRLRMLEGAIDGGLILDSVRWQHQGFEPRPEDYLLSTEA